MNFSCYYFNSSQLKSWLHLWHLVHYDKPYKVTIFNYLIFLLLQGITITRNNYYFGIIILLQRRITIYYQNACNNYLFTYALLYSLKFRCLSSWQMWMFMLKSLLYLLINKHSKIKWNCIDENDCMCPGFKNQYGQALF